MICEICKLSVFTGDVAPKLSYMPQTHHATFDSLLRSVYQKCFICVNVWASCAEISREVLSSEASEGSLTSYYLNSVSGGDSLQLDVQIQAIDLVKRFCLDPAADAPFAPPNILSFDTNTRSRKTLSQAVSWLTKCRTSHEICSQPKQSFVPTRLLDIREPISSLSYWYLSSSREEISERTAYATLSHCWGASAMTLKLSGSTYNTMLQGMPYSSLPNTFRDAVKIAQSLHQRYLWIDSLCIIQDSLTDWQIESAKMGQIYSNSICNIAATKSSNSHSGCFSDRDPALITRCIVTARWDGIPPTRYEIIVENFWTDQTSMAPLNQRGWVLQERVLSPRILHFGQNQVFWECRSQSCCEAYPFGLPALMDDGLHLRERAFSARTLHSLTEGEATHQQPGEYKSMASPRLESRPTPPIAGFYKYWDRIVQSYSACDLTKPGDKLVALSGLAQFVQKRTKSEYLAGLWREHLPEQLNWRIDPDVKAYSRRASEYRAPTWSWASLDGPILPRRSLNEGKCLIEVLEATTSPVHTDETGQVKDAYLRLQASILEIDGLVLRSGSALDAITFDGGKLRFNLTIQPDVTLSQGEIGSDIHLPSGEFEGSLWLMPISQSTPQPWVSGLVLILTQGRSLRFRRIGHFEAMDLGICQMFSSTDVDDHDRQMQGPRAIDGEITIE